MVYNVACGPQFVVHGLWPVIWSVLWSVVYGPQSVIHGLRSVACDLCCGPRSADRGPESVGLHLSEVDGEGPEVSDHRGAQ